MWHRLAARPQPTLCALRPSRWSGKRAPRGAWQPAHLQRGTARFQSQLALAAEWSPSAVKMVLEQVADDGALTGDLSAQLRRMQGTISTGSEVGAVAEQPPGDELIPVEGDSVECDMPDFLLALELCKKRRVRDFVLLARLADRLVPAVPNASSEELVRLSSAFAGLGALNQPIFDAIASALLVAWPASGSSQSSTAPVLKDILQVSRAFAKQRSRHVELFNRMVSVVDIASATPAEALSLLNSITSLRLDPELGDDIWSTLEERALEPGMASLGPGHLSQLCHCLFVSGRAGGRLTDVSAMLDALSGAVLAADEASWTTGEGPELQQRLLLLRSALRYLHRDVFQELSPGARNALRKVHRLESPTREPRPAVSFVKKLSHILTKLRVAHMCNAERGPFILDVVERDRKLVYECIHFDRFYMGTTEKIASLCLQERIVKAMGYRVVQVPHWQWNRLKAKRHRTEYVRMSRYYAIKDRREFGPRDEAPADVASNIFDYLGEYFFRKERPSAPWAWFQPRYDASKRVVPDAAKRKWPKDAAKRGRQVHIVSP